MRKILVIFFCFSYCFSYSQIEKLIQVSGPDETGYQICNWDSLGTRQYVKSAIRIKNISKHSIHIMINDFKGSGRVVADYKKDVNVLKPQESITIPVQGDPTSKNQLRFTKENVLDGNEFNINFQIGLLVFYYDSIKKTDVSIPENTSYELKVTKLGLTDLVFKFNDYKFNKYYYDNDTSKCYPQIKLNFKLINTSENTLEFTPNYSCCGGVSIEYEDGKKILKIGPGSFSEGCILMDANRFLAEKINCDSISTIKNINGKFPISYNFKVVEYDNNKKIVHSFDFVKNINLKIINSKVINDN